MLSDPERNDSADFLAIGDSMFHHITFEARTDLGETAKVSYRAKESYTATALSLLSVRAR